MKIIVEDCTLVYCFSFLTDIKINIPKLYAYNCLIWPIAFTNINIFENYETKEASGTKLYGIKKMAPDCNKSTEISERKKKL